MLRTLLTTSLLASLLALAGCDECGDIDCSCLQGGIYVDVVDASTKEPITMGVTVKTGNEACPERGPSPVCDVPPGSHTVEVSAIGYASKSVSAVLPPPQGDGCCVCGEIVKVTVELTKMP